MHGVGAFRGYLRERHLSHDLGRRGEFDRSNRVCDALGQARAFFVGFLRDGGGSDERRDPWRDAGKAAQPLAHFAN